MHSFALSPGSIRRSVARPVALLAALFVAGTALAEKPRPAPTATGSGSQGAPTQTAPSTPATSDKPAAPESKVSGAQKAGNANVVSTEENKEGVKTYKFGAVEVEGRLRSPQLTYFLRRVRAEFSAGDLGHRSFLRELAETTRHPSFR
jgi:hypothetical protein